ncbi:MAG: 4-hydroxy-3-methylbut-2-enyl diphosphate reductase [Marinifilaceae bacterium]|nr:4-hydroxy-3-methylbut-2-enyl diphosphate reductase [Marinifilaceae bacterium]
MFVEIDNNSGFCFGVVNAINKAENELAKGELYCVGDIVHNDSEVARLADMGLKTISVADMAGMSGKRVLFRAHGEPPASYALAKERRLEVIDASCPVVLNLQRVIKEAYNEVKEQGGLIVIYGKPGHAEVIGLVGQTNGEAVVVESLSDLQSVDFSRPIRLFSQTTQSLEGFKQLAAKMREEGGESVVVYDTICRKVANRIPQVRSFAAEHDVIFFVSGEKSSNGKQLYEVCKEVNPRSYFVQGADNVEAEMFMGAEKIGISGANSTPRRLMDEIKLKIEKLLKNNG